MNYQTIQIKCPLECFDDVLGVLEFDEYEFTYGESFDVKVSDFQQWQVLKNILVDVFPEFAIEISPWIPTDADYGLTV